MGERHEPDLNFLCDEVYSQTLHPDFAGGVGVQDLQCLGDIRAMSLAGFTGLFTYVNLVTGFSIQPVYVSHHNT